MEMLQFLLRSSNRLAIWALMASILSGLASAALIALIHRALQPGTLAVTWIALMFIGAVLVKSAMQYVAQLTLMHFTQDVVLRLCRTLCDRVLAAPFARLEALGAPRLLATLNDDVAVLAGAVQLLPSITTNLAVLAGCSGYLLWMSWQAFALCLVIIAVGVPGYVLLVRRAYASLRGARDSRDQLFGNFRTIIEGIKELKLNREKRRSFVTHEIDETTELLRGRNVSAMKRLLLADLWSQILFFVLIGLLLFAAPAAAGLSPTQLTGYVFAMLYMMPPVWSLVGSVPTFIRGHVSLAKIRELGAGLENSENHDALIAKAHAGSLAAAYSPGGPLHIQLEGASYTHPAPDEQDREFTLGPLDVELRDHEVLFITGGNGCGKSTLVRLLTGLYVPQKGGIRLNGQLINEDNRESYRQMFGAVFADFHLFERLYGLDAPGRVAEVQHYLTVLGMQDKVHLRGDRLSSTNLSSGQRRRLALLTTYLEDRPVYIFDEWAADQDPNYRTIFYNQLLPELKMRGKSVVVVTHDDRYFELADRVVKLEAGRIVGQWQPRHSTSQLHVVPANQ